MKGATVFARCTRRKNSDFNPRTREGCDANIVLLVRIISISIHAPVKGATADGDPDRGDAGISIHAPVKGATEIGAYLVEEFPFQSTHP